MKTHFQKTLDKAANKYDSEVTRLTHAAWLYYVIPFCDKKGWRFTAGMGGFSFNDKDGRYVEHDRLPKRLLAVLEGELLGRNNAGALMDDYTPTNYKT